MKLSKTLWTALVLSVVPGYALAQGALEFKSALNGPQAVPPNSSTIRGNGSFSLEGTLLTMAVGVNWGDRQITKVELFRSTSPLEGGTRLYDLPFFISVAPYWDDGVGLIPGQDIYTSSIQVSSTDIQDLFAGSWYANVSTVAFPNGEIRGQINLVPEPKTCWLCLLGVGYLAALHQKRGCIKSKNRPSG